MLGFHNRMLRIDLTKASTRVEPLPDGVLSRTLGGKGLGTYLLLQDLEPGLDPLAPENEVIFATGPATGTTIWGGSRLAAFTKAPLTGIYGESYVGGGIAPQAKRTGYDAVILEGRSEVPLYLVISDQGVEFRDATHLWGQETFAAEKAMLREVGEEKAHALVIGPAGEKRVSFALIKSDLWRSFGRGGFGAVLGSKGIKGIVFYGAQKCPISDERLLLGLNREIAQAGKGSPVTQIYRNFGTPNQVKVTNTFGCFPTRYWSEGRLENWQNLSADYMQEHFEVKSKACPNCFLMCTKQSAVKEGPYQGLHLEGPEFETIYALGGLNCLSSLEEVAYLNDLCDRLGMDTMTAGNVTAFAIEAAKQGRLDFPIDYGQTGRIADLLCLIAAREGVGKVLSQGVRAAAREIGLEGLAVHVKGMEPGGFDPRALKGMGLAYAISDRGACHLRGTFYKAELSGQIDAATTEGKAALFVDYEGRAILSDSLILCRFFRDLIGWKELSTLISATTGTTLNPKELASFASRINTWTRIFNVREGISRRDDTLPDLFFERPLPDGRIIKREELATMLDEYYTLHGWDPEGRPSPRQFQEAMPEVEEISVG
ncbi:MAG: aldehyde ferredoxin oxidoreductase family protein [candidate division NC10 bacterium]|nr:aldehyde ferredoxin oxidoreductase family protein [candidate division NC10 bacterium]